MKLVDKEYCMSSYLTFKFIEDANKVFKEKMYHKTYVSSNKDKIRACYTSEDVDNNIKELLTLYLKSAKGKVGILLSGGIDSAILASYLPKGTKAYTARCVDGKIDESPRAAQYAKIYELDHTIVDIKWDQYLRYVPELMLHHGCPVSSNEPQIYQLVLAAKADGVEHIIFGDNADMAFGGLNELLSKDWTFDEWVKRYSYVNIKNVLRRPIDVNSVYEKYRTDGDRIDFITFLSEVFAAHSTGAYLNAFEHGNIQAFDPYASLMMGEKLDLIRVRAGENKYLLRELFQKKYPGLEVPYKLAMPRAVDEWLKDWAGPVRREFWPNCTKQLSGEGKWMVYALEWFLDLIEYI